MEMATLIAKNNQASVMGIKQILLKDMTADLEGMWQNEKDFTNVVKGYGVEDAFPEFIARKGRAQPMENLRGSTK
jgi:hypothetical protein